MTVLGLDVDDEQLLDVCSRFGVARLEVFGSTGRGESQPDSDVDLLYVLKPGARLGWRIEDLADELSAILGRPVDLVSRSYPPRTATRQGAGRSAPAVCSVRFFSLPR